MGEHILVINDVPGRPDFEMRADTRSVPPATIAGCLRGLESVAVEAALDRAAATHIRPQLVPAS
jgi:hypothetical protein